MSLRKYNEMYHTSSGWKKEILFEKVVVTPELATALLKLNTENRPVKSGVLAKYIKDLQNGTFHFTGDSIKISKDKVLLDGQHRLMAIVSADIPMKLHIQAGLDPAVFTVLDTGSSRSISDIMALKHYKYYTQVATVARLVDTILKDKPIGGADSKLTRGNNEQLAIVESLDKDLLEESCTVAMESRNRNRLIDRNLIAAMHYVIALGDKKSTFQDFVYLLSTGDGLGSSNFTSVWLLRNKLIENMTAHSKLTMSAKYFLLVSCWNAFVKNKVMKRLPKFDETQPQMLT